MRARDSRWVAMVRVWRSVWLGLAGIGIAVCCPAEVWGWSGDHGIAQRGIAATILADGNIGFGEWAWMVAAGALGITGLVMAWQQRRYRQQTELFRVVSDNAADMIALVDVSGKRLYNSPAYEKVLGYSAEELATTSAFDQIHPEDQSRVKEASEQAKKYGIGKRLEYRMRHKDGTWRVLESTASIIRDGHGQVKQLVIVNRDVTERKAVEDKLEHNAFHDALTNLPNRNLFLDRLARASEYAKRHADFKFAVLFVHIKGLKIVNETMGHAVVDQVITDLSRRLKEQLRHDDFVSRTKPMGVVQPEGGPEILARIDGEQFTILLEGIKEPSDPIRVAVRVQESLAEPFAVEGMEVFTSPSIGIAMSTTSTHTPAEMLRDADIAMCRAKAREGSSYEVFDKEMHQVGVKRLQCETELRRALVREEFVVYYQPIVDMATGRVKGTEALVRWKHPERDLLAPGEFIEVAEDTGLIVDIGRWVLREACRQTKLWQGFHVGDALLTVTVNVSMRQFVQGDVVADVRNALNETGLPPKSLHIEITETMAMTELKTALRILTQLRELGVCISLDDFGTGHSSLSRLHGFPLDVVKIDRSFVKGLGKNLESREIARLIVMLAQHLNLKVIAEGIEDEGQKTCLMQFGCALAQGYMYSAPVEPAALHRMLNEGFAAKTASAAAGAGGKTVSAPAAGEMEFEMDVDVERGVHS